MPKLKTKKSAAKRMKMTKSGKVKFQQPGKRNLLERHSSKMKRQARKGQYVDGANMYQVRQMLPYG